MHLFVKAVSGVLVREFGLGKHLTVVSICNFESARPIICVLTIAVPTVAEDVSGMEGIRTRSKRERFNASLLGIVSAVLRQLPTRP
jgi:hypothetical protein